ncbi:MAG: helix-turn-helix domain-containing protein [Desulfobulbaceae bacterium]
MIKPGKNVSQQQEQGQENMAGFDHAGTYLHKLRTEKGLSLKEVCEATRVSEINLRAMEDQDFAALPADTFTRGMLGIYARFLGVDPALVVARFMRERDQNQAHAKRVKSRPVVGPKILSTKKLAEPAHVSSITMATILFLFIVVLFTGFCLYTSWNPFSFLARETDSIQSTVMHAFPENQEAASGQEEAGSDAPAGDQPQPLATVAEQTSFEQGTPTGTISVTVEFLKDARLTLTSNNEQPVSALYKKGEKLSWPGAESMQLTFDQPDSALILVNDQPVSFPAESSGLYTLHLPADISQPAAP